MHYTSLTWIVCTVLFITQYLLTPISRSGFYFLGLVAVLHETTRLFSSRFTTSNWSYIKWCPAFLVLQSYYQWVTSWMLFPHASVATSLSEAPLFSLCSCTFSNRLPCHPHRRRHSFLIPPLACDNFHRLTWAMVYRFFHLLWRTTYILAFPTCDSVLHIKLATAFLWFFLYVCVTVYPSSWKNLAPTGRTFMKFDIWAFLKNLSTKFKFHENLTRITNTSVMNVRLDIN